MKKLFLGITPALILVGLLWPKIAFSQALDLTVSPVSLDYSPNPGQTITDKVSLYNNSTAPVTLTLSVNTMTVDEQGRVVPNEISASDSASKWITFNSPTITVPVKEWYEVPFTITIPTDAAYGNYFALVFAPPQKAPGGGTAAVQGNILVPILLNVKKAGVLTQANITDFSIKNFVTQYLPAEFTVQVKNSGNVHVRPRGNIFIRGTGQKDIAVLEVNAGQGSILPQASRTFQASWSDGFLVKEPVVENGIAKLDSNGNPVTKLTVNWNKLTDFRLGKYTAYLLLVYDDGTRDVPIDATINFWVFPYIAVGIILAVVITLFLVVVYVFKALVKKEAKKLQS